MSFMDKVVARNGLTDIAEKVFAAQRITDAEALRLYEIKDLNALGYLANHVRERKNGNVATYVLNLYLNYSNICILSCQFCAFARRPHEKEGQFTYDIEEMARQAKAAEGNHRSAHRGRAASEAAVFVLHGDDPRAERGVPADGGEGVHGD